MHTVRWRVGGVERTIGFTVSIQDVQKALLAHTIQRPLGNCQVDSKLVLGTHGRPYK